MPYTQTFTAADQRTPPVTFPGVVDTSWRVTTPVSGGVDQTDLDVLSFAALNMSYVRLATAYRQTATAVSGYNAEYIVSAISNSWTGSAMPTTGSATYNGNSFGIAITPGATLATTSAFSMSANFATGTVAGSLTGFQFFDRNTGSSAPTPSGITGLSINFSASITGDTFSALNGPISGSAISSSRVEGQFAGPHAEEVGGAFQAIGPSVAIVGGFLGKR
jgi:hypothetical protein